MGSAKKKTEQHNRKSQSPLTNKNSKKETRKNKKKLEKTIKKNRKTFKKPMKNPWFGGPFFGPAPPLPRPGGADGPRLPRAWTPDVTLPSRDGREEILEAFALFLLFLGVSFFLWGGLLN